MEEKKQLEVLFRISRALVGKQDLDDILYQIVTLTADLIDSKICSLMLLDEKKNQLVLRTTQSVSPSYRNKPPVRAGQSVSGRVVRNGEPVQVRDVTLDDQYSCGRIAREEGVKSLLSVPMFIGDKAIGVLNCYTENEKVFKLEEIKLVQTIANQAAMAIEHMRILDKEKTARLALETKRVVDQAKRILFKKHRMSEEDAHRLIQRTSMENGKTLKDVSDAIILAAGIKLDSYLESK